MGGKFRAQQDRAARRLAALPQEARPVFTRPLVSSAKMPRVARPRGEVTPQQLRRISRAVQRHVEAESEWRATVVAVLAEGASFAEVSKATGLSTNTLQRWKREAAQ